MQDERTTIGDLTVHLKRFSQEFERDDVILAITFLYALGKVEYSLKKDTVWLLNAAEVKKVA